MFKRISIGFLMLFLCTVGFVGAQDDQTDSTSWTFYTVDTLTVRVADNWVPVPEESVEQFYSADATGLYFSDPMTNSILTFSRRDFDLQTDFPAITENLISDYESYGYTLLNYRNVDMPLGGAFRIEYTYMVEETPYYNLEYLINNFMGVWWMVATIPMTLEDEEFTSLQREMDTVATTMRLTNRIQIPWVRHMGDDLNTMVPETWETREPSGGNTQLVFVDPNTPLTSVAVIYDPELDADSLFFNDEQLREVLNNAYTDEGEATLDLYPISTPNGDGYYLRANIIATINDEPTPLQIIEQYTVTPDGGLIFVSMRYPRDLDDDFMFTLQQIADSVLLNSLPQNENDADAE